MAACRQKCPLRMDAVSRLTLWIQQAQSYARDRIATLRLRPERILVIHIMKTAGTSLRRMLQDEYGPHFVYPGDEHLRFLPHGWYPPGSEILRGYAKLPPHNVLIGHFTAAMAEMLPRSYQAATVLRDPVQRSLSMVSHFSLVTKKSVSELMADEQFVIRHIADYQTRILGVDGIYDPDQMGAADDATLTRAIARLQTLAFVGLTERFEDSCRLFDQRFRTQLSRLQRRENVLRQTTDELAEFVPRIEPYIQRDRVLYDTAQRCFSKACGEVL